MSQPPVLTMAALAPHLNTAVSSPHNVTSYWSSSHEVTFSLATASIQSSPVKHILPHDFLLVIKSRGDLLISYNLDTIISSKTYLPHMAQARPWVTHILSQSHPSSATVTHVLHDVTVFYSHSLIYSLSDSPSLASLLSSLSSLSVSPSLASSS